MIPLYAIGIGATVWAALVVGLSLTSFRPSIAAPRRVRK